MLQLVKSLVSQANNLSSLLQESDSHPGVTLPPPGDLWQCLEILELLQERRVS